MGRKRKNIFELKQSSFRVKKSKLNVKSKINNKPTNSINEESPLDSFDTQNRCPIDLNNSLEISNTDSQTHSTEVNLFQNFKLLHEASNSEDVDLGKFVVNILRKNSIKYNLGRICVSNMLKDFKKRIPNIPSDYRTLLKTPRSTDLRDVSPGQYTHLGILQNLLNILSPDDTFVKLDIFIDGFTVYRDTSLKSFWIILARHNKNIFPVGIYNGVSQPNDFNDFLLDFCIESKNLIRTGITNNNSLIEFGFNKFLMDSPAKSHVTLTKLHIGYDSCYYCEIHGYHDGSRVCFLEVDCKLRTDKEFKDKVCKSFHRGTSILESLEIDMIDQVPIDYLHCVLLGTTKKILMKLFIHKSPMLNSVIQNKVSQKMIFCNQFLSSEIHRNLRSLKDLKSFHGNELRVFLLKIGIVVMKNVVPNDIYNNFLLLNVAITVLCDKNLCITKNNFASKCLKIFIRDAIEIYGTEIATSVLHDLQHLPLMVQKYQEPLDAFSTFPFENYLLKLKEMVHTNNHPIPQIHRRIVEKLKFEECQDDQDVHNNSNRFIIKQSRVTSVFINNFKFSAIGSRDRFFLCNNNDVYVILDIKKKNDKPIFKARKLKSLGSFYNLPINSSDLNIYECKTSYEGPVTYISHSKILFKMMGIPYSSYSMVFVPLKDLN